MHFSNVLRVVVNNASYNGLFGTVVFGINIMKTRYKIWNETDQFFFLQFRFQIQINFCFIVSEETFTYIVTQSFIPTYSSYGTLT